MVMLPSLASQAVALVISVRVVPRKQEHGVMSFTVTVAVLSLVCPKVLTDRINKKTGER
jgi:hypothetical protein